MVNIEIDNGSGFCFGVTTAIKKAEEELAKGNKLYCLGDIVHNGQECERLKKLGLITINHEEFAQLSNAKVLLRAHGEPPATYELAQKNHIEIVDATCPFVKRIHKIVSRAEEQGRIPVIIGTRAHPEVLAIAGWCTHPMVFETPEELAQWLQADEERKRLPLTMVCQTTSTQKLWENCREIIKKVCI